MKQAVLLALPVYAYVSNIDPSDVKRWKDAGPAVKVGGEGPGVKVEGEGPGVKVGGARAAVKVGGGSGSQGGASCRGGGGEEGSCKGRGRGEASCKGVKV